MHKPQNQVTDLWRLFLERVSQPLLRWCGWWRNRTIERDANLQL